MTGSGRERGTAASTPFRVGDARWGLARVPILPFEDSEPEAPIDPAVAEGMFLSSEVAADSAPASAGRRRATARAFQIRARRRTTPQGVFAAVAELEVTGAATVLAVGGRRTRSYPSPVWLHEACERAVDRPEVLRGLTFTTNNIAVRRGDRLEVECPSDTTLAAPRRVSVRATKVVDVIMEVCRGGASWHQVTAALVHRWPNVPDDAATSVLRTLARNGFVLTDLLPADLCNDPIGHVLDRLPRGDPLRGDLSRLRAVLAEADAYPPGHAVRRTELEAARRITDDVAPTRRPICVDCSSDARILIPEGVAQRAAEAAGVLWRLGPGHDRLADWHRRFLDRYGPQRLVPLVDACDPVTGLGCDVGTVDRPPLPDVPGVLTGLLIEALTSGGVEVRLGPATVKALDRRAPGDRPEPSVEVYARVIAPSVRDRDAGNIILAITGTAAPAGATRSRFTGLLPAVGIDADTGHDTITAELVCQPLSHAAATLTARADSASWRIPIGTAPRPSDLLLHDLTLVSDGHRLRLWSIRHRRPVRPMHRNRLGHHLMPPLARFLCLVGQHGTIPLNPWTWAPLDRAPFLPRVRYQDTILTPARWRLPESLRRAASDRTTWTDALHDWRSSTRPAPPGTVVVNDTDRRLALKLDRDDDCELLRRYLARGVAAVTEPPGGSEAVQAVASGPSGHHALEIVVPLVAERDPEPAFVPTSPAKARGLGESMFPPGGQWLSLAVNAPPSTQDAVVERIVRAAHDTAEVWDRWFWLRYTTGERGPHLRVRFHGDPATLGGRLLPILRLVCTRLTTEGLSGGFTVEPYDPETERYGGHNAIDAAEMIFHHDSELAAAILATTADPDERMALTAISAAEIARTITEDDRRTLAPYRLERDGRRAQARIRPHCRALDDAIPPHQAVWQARASALKVYRDLLPSSRRVDCASSLIHMHANRVLGDNHHERIARALAADLIARRTP